MPMLLGRGEVSHIRRETEGLNRSTQKSPKQLASGRLALHHILPAPNCTCQAETCQAHFIACSQFQPPQSPNPQGPPE